MLQIRLESAFHNFLQERAEANFRTVTQEVKEILLALMREDGQRVIVARNAATAPKQGRKPAGYTVDMEHGPRLLKGQNHPHYHGVVSAGPTQGWNAEFWRDGTRSKLGHFDSDYDAAHAVDEKTREICNNPGEAVVNFPKLGTREISHVEADRKLKEAMTATPPPSVLTVGDGA